MGLFKNLRTEFIDIIEWTDQSNNELGWRFERHENETNNLPLLSSLADWKYEFNSPFIKAQV